MTVADGIVVRAGFIHDRSAPEVIETIKSMLKRITAAGKPAMSCDQRRCESSVPGVSFEGERTDPALLLRISHELKVTVP